MGQFNHHNIVRLEGVVTKRKSSVDWTDDNVWCEQGRNVLVNTCRKKPAGPLSSCERGGNNAQLKIGGPNGRTFANWAGSAIWKGEINCLRQQTLKYQ